MYAGSIGRTSVGPTHRLEGALTPVVTTAIGSLQPLPPWAAEWWAADNVPVDLLMDVDVGSHESSGAAPRGLVTRYLTFVSDLLSGHMATAVRGDRREDVTSPPAWRAALRAEFPALRRSRAAMRQFTGVVRRACPSPDRDFKRESSRT